MKPQLAVSDRTAAAMLEMDTATFHDLVARGALPGPRRIGDVERWSVDQLRSVVSGERAKPDQDIEV